MFKKILFVLVLLFSFSACASRSEQAVNSESGDDTDYCNKLAAECVDKNVMVEGTVSDVIWQHMIDPSGEYLNYEYVDVDDYGQIVVYSKLEIECKNRILFVGKLKEIIGPGKDISQNSSKEDDSYKEYHVLADSWECL